MKKSIFFPFILSFLLLFSCVNSKDVEIGVSPGIVEMGELERGSSELVKFYVVTHSEDTILVYLEKSKGNFDFFNRDNFRNMVLNYSEEDTVSWLKILNNPVELKRSDEKLFEYNMRNRREVSLILNIPDNAESGYHIISIIPSPALGGETNGQVGTQMVAVTPVRIFFNIPGEAIRDGKILDVFAKKINENRVEIDIHFLNSGTVTISARAVEILIKDSEGNLIKKLNSNIGYVKPGEIEILKAYLPMDDLEYGDYNVFTKVDYTTNSTYLNSIVTLKESSMEKITAKVHNTESKFSWWMLIILIVIVILIYKWMRKWKYLK